LFPESKHWTSKDREELNSSVNKLQSAPIIHTVKINKWQTLPKPLTPFLSTPSPHDPKSTPTHPPKEEL